MSSQTEFKPNKLKAKEKINVGGETSTFKHKILTHFIVELHLSPAIQKIFRVDLKYLKNFLAWAVDHHCTERINNVNFVAAGDLVTFSKMKSHYKTEYQLDTKLFTKESRSEPIQQLYDQARDKHQLQVRNWLDVMQNQGESLGSQTSRKEGGT